jgi:iron complex outermembrane receptor protein
MSMSIQTNRRFLKAWAAATIAAALCAGASMAQQAATTTQTAAPEANLQEIVVTAQFRQENVQNVPLAITAVTGPMIEARGQLSLADIGQQAPNVQLIPTGGAFGPGMTAYIRGIGQADFDPAFAPGVGIYINDVYYTSLTGSDFALLDLDRVEILRGPQGTLSGANSEGGSIKLYTVKPQGDDTGSVKVQYGQRNLIDVQAIGDFSLIPGSLFMRISGVAHDEDGYVTRYDYGCLLPASGIPSSGGYSQNCVAGKEGGKDYHAGRAALRWLASDNFEVNLIGDVSIDNSESAGVTLLAVNPGVGWPAGLANSGLPATINPAEFIPKNPYVSYANFCAKGLAGNTYCWPPYTYTKEWGTNLTMDWKLSDIFALKSITAYREFDSQWINDDDASPVGSSLGWSEVENHTFTQELRLSGSVSSVIDYTLGGFVLDQVTTYPTHQVLDYIVPGLLFEFLGDDPIAERDHAGFANATWHIVEGLDLNLGVRYTNQTKDYTYNRYNPSSIGGGQSVFYPTPFVNGEVGRYSGSHTDYRADLDYHWTSEFMTYASVSTGFKGGGSNPRPFIASQIQPFADETLTAYEVGAKSDWLDHSLRVNVAAFYNKYKNMQVVLLSCPEYSKGYPPSEPCAAPVNGGDSNIYGGELELNYHLGGFSLDGSYGHQHFEFTSVAPNTGISLGDLLPGFQQSKWSLGAQYEWHLPNAASITPRLDWSYSSGYYTNADNDPESWLPGYHLLNGRLTYKPDSDSWSISVVGYNLANSLWYTQVFDLTTLEGQKYGIPSEPRTVSIEFRKKFGPPPPPPPPVVKEVVREVVKEVVREVPVPAPAPVLPPAPRGDIILQGVNFATNSADLIPNSTSALDREVNQLKAYPNIAIEVRGYTDSRGSAAYNLNLSQRRAESVMHYLQQHGVTNQMSAKGFGKEDPIADNTTKDGQLTNRRVTLHIEGGAP